MSQDVAKPAGRLSVLIISPHPQVHGGVSTFIETMKPHLQHCDVTPYWIGSITNEEESTLSTFKRLLLAPWEVVSLVRGQKIDVVHINPSLDPKSTFRDGLILLALRVAGFRRTLVYFHGWQARVEQALRRLPIINSIARWLLGGVGHIMVLSQSFKQGLVALGVEDNLISVTHTMFDGALLANTPEPEPANRPFILFMSRFERTKGVYELLQAFAAIAPQFTELELVYAGDGAERAGLEAMTGQLGLGNRVSFTGYIRGEEKARLLKQCTLFALPTYFPEGLPVALLEAMAAGKPLLTAAAGGIGECIHEPQNGVVLTSVTHETVKQALLKLLGDKANLTRIGEHNRDYAWKHFEAAVVSAEIEAVYQRIAAAI